MIDRRIAFAAGVTLALLAARVSAQSCTVTLVYPAETLSMSSDSCTDTAWCLPNPGGCRSIRLHLDDVLTVGIAPTLDDRYQADGYSNDHVSTPTQDWAGRLSWDGVEWVLNVSNTVFTGGFDQ
jgi:hypothetical protein